MNAVARLLDRIRGKGFAGKENHVAPPAAEHIATTVETIPPAPPSTVSTDMKTWAERAEVTLAPVDGVWWYSGAALAEAQQGGGWLGLHFHGGGYVLGSAKDVRSGFARIPRGFVERRICSCVLSLEYSLTRTGADESKRPFPLQIMEALSAYHHLLVTLKIPPHRVLLIGDSAGAHLALALQRYLLESGCVPSPRGLVLLSPWCDLSVEADRVGALLGPLSAQDLAGPYFSPALHPPPPQWPPTLIYSGAQERFEHSIAALSSRLSEAGVEVTSYEAMGILSRYSHDFLIFGTVEQAWPDEVRECWTRIKAWTDALYAA